MSPCSVSHWGDRRRLNVLVPVIHHAPRLAHATRMTSRSSRPNARKLRTRVRMRNHVFQIQARTRWRIHPSSSRSTLGASVSRKYVIHPITYWFSIASRLLSEMLTFRFVSSRTFLLNRSMLFDAILSFEPV